ncbi:predicted protein [Naegleria gruberi]|uniref:Predicted protein n=1 Tax=Naegleria gruberi TaxID=5762 RepID=D2V500_NAEGR|nr:uncharacterized protein NAEGRDRAFT_63963 [Naegleria gruberi]EFC48192.1 predicted protein [Naegleria gruberi]|eukprot:XP_002680936.1 predicted protein [Naegleria gruberi strain NEG-M]
MSLLQMLLSSSTKVGVSSSTIETSFSSSNDNNSSSTTTILNNSNRIASEIYLQHLDPYTLSGISLGIEVIFIPIFLGLVTFIAVFMTRKDIRKVMARNQKILLTLVIILLIIQCVGLTFRGIFDSLTINIVHDILTTIEKEEGIETANLALSSMNSTTSAAQAGVQDSKVIALYLMGSFEIMTQVQNMTLIIFIILFISNVFLNTVGMATGIISTRKMTILRYLVNVLGGSAIVILLLVITATAISYFIIKIRIAFDFQTYLYVVVYIIFVVTVVFHGLISNIVGCAVFSVIRRRTSKHNKQSNQQSLRKVVILQLGVNISALIQLFAGIFIALSSEYLHLKLVFYFFNNVGIVIFACLVFSLYHPLFTGAVKELNEMKEKSSQSGGDSSRYDQAKELSDKSVMDTCGRNEKRKSRVQPLSPRPQQQVGVKLLEEKKVDSEENQPIIVNNDHVQVILEENQPIVCNNETTPTEPPIEDKVEDSIVV